MLTVDFLSAEMFSVWRTPNELYAWVHDILRRFAERDDLRKVILLRQGVAKKLVEEVYPTALFLRNVAEGRTDVSVSFSTRYEQHDAVLSLPGAETPKNVPLQCAFAVNGYDDHLRMRYLLKHGHVSLTGRVSHTGTVATGHDVRVSNETRAVDDSDAEVNRLLCGALTAKLAKKYPDWTWLLVAVDDHYLTSRRGQISGLESVVDGLMPELSLAFERVSVQGLSGRLHYDWLRSKR